MHFELLNALNEIKDFPKPRQSVVFDGLRTQYYQYLNMVRVDRTHLGLMALKTTRRQIAESLNCTPSQIQEMNIPLEDVFDKVLRPSMQDFLNPHNKINVFDYQKPLELYLSLEDRPPVGLQMFVLASYHYANLMRVRGC